MNELKEVRKQLDELLIYKAEGALTYANRTFYVMGNKASRLLAFHGKDPKRDPSLYKETDQS